MALRISGGTGASKSFCAAGEKSRTDSQFPVSFSTWIMMTVRWGSVSFRCRIREVNAALSTSSVVDANGDRLSTASPSRFSACG